MRAAVVLVVLSVAVACSVDSGLDVESRQSTPTDVAPADDETTTAESTSTTTTTPGASATIPEQPDDESPVVEFVLGEVVVEVALSPTTAPRPFGGSDGFRSAA